MRDGGLRQQLQSADEQFSFVDHFWGEMVVEEEEEFFVAHDFVSPCVAVDFL